MINKKLFALITVLLLALLCVPVKNVLASDAIPEATTEEQAPEATTEEQAPEQTTEKKETTSVDSFANLKPVLTGINYNGKCVTITWKKVIGATGYYVYRKTGKGKYRYIATVKKYRKYSDTKMSKGGRKYSYAVKAYQLKKGKKYKTKISTARSVTTRLLTKIKRIKDSRSIMYGKKIRLYYETNGTRIYNLSGILSLKNKTIVLYVSKAKQYVTAYLRDGSVYIPFRTMICSTAAYSPNTPTGTFHTKGKYRWHTLIGDCYGQWCTRIVNGILFHSVFYTRYGNNHTLSVAAYNKLGQPASHGCVRVNCNGAKWIYDHCKIGTTVVIHNRSGYEPMKKPASKKLAASHTWDPTDPYAR